MMKSTDMGKVEMLLDKIKSLKKEILLLNTSKENGIDDFTVRVDYRYFEIDGVLAQKILNMILEDFNIELNGYIEELKQVGGEYVDETAETLATYKRIPSEDY